MKSEDARAIVAKWSRRDEMRMRKQGVLHPVEDIRKIPWYFKVFTRLYLWIPRIVQERPMAMYWGQCPIHGWPHRDGECQPCADEELNFG